MASIPSSAPSEARVEGGVGPASHVAHAAPDGFKQGLGRQQASACPGSEGERENDDDALVPSLFKDTPSTSASAAAPTPAKSNWDAAFYSNTPTPKPPPRLAPMPRSPPPSLVIQTQLSSASPTTPGHPAGQSPKPTSRYASAYHAHNRSVSQSQAHSNHGNNVFTHAAGGSRSLAALATSGPEQPPIGIIFSPERISDEPAATNTTIAAAATAISGGHPRSHSILTHTSPAATRHSSSTNIFRDPPPAHLAVASWASSQSVGAESGGSEFSESNPAHLPTLDDSAPGSGAGQRKIYPGLKNTIGPYKLLHSIGQGSFSEVKLAIDTRTGDHVAIKVVSRAMIQSSERLGISVRRESDLLKSIRHPNIIGFREVVETSLQMCIVLDYASGGELFEFVADKRAMASEQDMQYIFAQIVDAVDYLHQHNTVHRDLKLENVLLEPRKGAPLRPKVKLTDFGLAKVIEQESPLLTTRCGSEDYAAPEIILGQPYDGREADIWSLGVLLYALLVGFLPFNMRPGMSRKSFLSVIAHAEFGFPGEKVVSKRTSLMKLHERSLSSASTVSSSSLSAATPAAPAATTTSAAATSFSNNGALLPAAPVDAIVAEDSAIAAFVVPRMRGVSSVSNESKDLVRWLLQTQGSARPTARQLYDHPWVAAGRQAVLDSD
ncbi:NUAK SNF1-like kinase 1 [Mortierella alpina]|nr:NUAK SNF1-like kinase 1 [Mortierella alpina]